MQNFQQYDKSKGEGEEGFDFFSLTSDINQLVKVFQIGMKNFNKKENKFGGFLAGGKSVCNQLLGHNLFHIDSSRRAKLLSDLLVSPEFNSKNDQEKKFILLTILFSLRQQNSDHLADKIMANLFEICKQQNLIQLKSSFLSSHIFTAWNGFWNKENTQGFYATNTRVFSNAQCLYWMLDYYKKNSNYVKFKNPLDYLDQCYTDNATIKANKIIDVDNVRVFKDNEVNDIIKKMQKGCSLYLELKQEDCLENTRAEKIDKFLKSPDFANSKQKEYILIALLYALNIGDSLNLANFIANQIKQEIGVKQEIGAPIVNKDEVELVECKSNNVVMSLNAYKFLYGFINKYKDKMGLKETAEYFHKCFKNKDDIEYKKIVLPAAKAKDEFQECKTDLTNGP